MQRRQLASEPFDDPRPGTRVNAGFAGAREVFRWSLRVRKKPNIASRMRSSAYNLNRADGTVDVRHTRRCAALDLIVVLKLPQLT